MRELKANEIMLNGIIYPIIGPIRRTVKKK